MNEEDVNALNEDDFFLKLMQDSGLTVSLTVRYKIRSGIIMAQILIKYVLYLPYWKNIVSWHCKLKMIIFYYFKEKKQRCNCSLSGYAPGCWPESCYAGAIFKRTRDPRCAMCSAQKSGSI